MSIAGTAYQIYVSNFLSQNEILSNITKTKTKKLAVIEIKKRDFFFYLANISGPGSVQVVCFVCGMGGGGGGSVSMHWPFTLRPGVGRRKWSWRGIGEGGVKV